LLYLKLRKFADCSIRLLLTQASLVLLIGLALSRLSFLRTGLALLLSPPSGLRGRRVLEGDRDLELEGRLLVLLFRRGGESDREDEDESESESDVPEEESLSLSLSDDDDELEVNEIKVRPEHDHHVVKLRMIKIRVLTRMIFAFVSCPCSSSRPTSVELPVQPRSYPLGLSWGPQQRFLMSQITATWSLVGLLTWS
jgi:hypothetical protein